MECARGTVRGFNAHYNKCDTLIQLLLVGLYRIIGNVLESARLHANISIGGNENRIMLF